jgi:uncharacterized protein YqeY
MEKLRADQLHARVKAQSENPSHGVKAKLLTTLIGEAAMIGKNAGNRETTDDEAIAVIQKFVKNINETLASHHDKMTDEAIVAANAELVILSQYLPEKLTDEQIVSEIAGLGISNAEKSYKGSVFAHFKKNFAGKYDAADIMRLM